MSRLVSIQTGNDGIAGYLDTTRYKLSSDIVFKMILALIYTTFTSLSTVHDTGADLGKGAQPD